MSNLGLSPQLDVFVGSWTNWSHGRILGATLTLSQRNGNLLVAFVALFVTFVGTCSFRLACVAFHRSFSTQDLQDAVYHQRQAILRKSANGITALWQMSQLLWTWRGKAPHTTRRILPVAFYVAVNLLAFATCGVISSNIAAMTGQEVLLKESPFCGTLLTLGNTTAEDYATKIYPLEAQKHNSAFNYVQDCYSTHGKSGSCGLYVQPRVRSHVERNANCPFESTICRTQDKNIKLDTGLLGSDSHFGINAPAHKAIFVRRLLHCGPLVTVGYSQSVNLSSIPFTRYYYGPQSRRGEEWANHTYQHSQRRMIDGLGLQRQWELTDYDISTAQSFHVSGEAVESVSNFHPIQALNRTDADVFIIFLSANNVMYSKPFNGYWFAAHQKGASISSTFDVESYQQMFGADEAASPLGCAAQYQTCLAGKRCSSVGSKVDMSNPLISFPEATQEEQSNIRYMWKTLAAVISSDQLDFFGQASLMARYSLSRGLQGPLPDDQWQLEIERWHNTTIAGYQDIFVRRAAGMEETILPFFKMVRDSPTIDACKNQKVRSTAYTNFSIFGLSFILVIGSILIILSYTLEAFTFEQLTRRWNKRHAKETPYHQLEWYTNGTLQLQRLAHEELGFGEWEGCDKDIPLTKEPCVLASLNVDNVEHPTLAPLPSFSRPNTLHSTSDNSGTHSESSQDEAIETQNNPIEEHESLEQGSIIEGPLPTMDEEIPSTIIQGSHSQSHTESAANTRSCTRPNQHSEAISSM